MNNETNINGERFRTAFANTQRELKELLIKKPELKRGLELTLEGAVRLAKELLAGDIFTGLDKEHSNKGWPTTIEEWSGVLEDPKNEDEFRSDENGDPDCFLWQSATWLPNEDGDIWTGKNGYNEKIYHVLCHFYLLISVNWVGDKNHRIPDESYVQPQLDNEFNDWLVRFIKVYELFLDSEYSLKKFKGDLSWDQICDDREIRDSRKYKGFTLERFKDNRSSWKTFNQFFYRRFNGGNHRNGGISPTENVIHDPENNRVVTSPAFCTFKAGYRIEKNGDIRSIDEFPRNDRNNEVYDIAMKGGNSESSAHTKGFPVSNISDLIGTSNYVEDFYGGTFVHYFLSPYDYHRYHLPVSGKVVQAKQIPGHAYLNVIWKNDDEMIDGRPHAPDDATDGYEFVQSRGLLIIDTKYYLDDNGEMRQYSSGDPNDIGKVAVIPVGMCQVSGVGINEALEGDVVVKGWEFGRFKFGGSDIILLFDKRATLEFDHVEEKRGHFEFGQRIATVKHVENA